MPTPSTLSRRSFLTRLAAVGAAIPTIATLSAACAPSTARPQNGTSAEAGVERGPTAVADTISLMITADPIEEAAYTTLLRAFQEAGSALEVDLVNMPGLADMYRRLLLDFASGTPADLFLLNYRRYVAFAAKKTLEGLAPYLAASTVIKAADFYAEVMEAFTWQEQLFGIPQNLSSLVVYYNKTIFDAAGVVYPSDDWTWDDFVQTAHALILDQDGDGVMDVWGLGTDAITLRVAPFIWMAGGDLVDNPQHPTQLALDSAEARLALAWFVALQTEHQVVPDPLTEKAESHETRFINGRLAMYLESRRVTPSLRQNTTFDWDVAPLPRLPTSMLLAGRTADQRRSTVLHSDAFCMAAQSQNKSAAWSLLEYANSPAGQTVLTRTGRVVPSNQRVAASSAFLDPAAKPAHSQVFLDSLAYIRRLPIMPTWTEIEAGISRELELAFHGDSTLDAAIDAAYIRTREFFRP
jgi:multiple sugar transport system substrate-binding protein